MSILIKGLSLGDLKRGDVFIVKMFGSPCLCRVKGGIGSPLLDDGGIFWTEEVPTPHGRLIDADKLIDDAHIHWSATTNESCFLCDDIDDAPTSIDAED